MSNTQNKPTPHRHAKLIKAWANGAKIQMFNFRDKKWEDSDSPTWLGDKYRIKPEEPSNDPWKPKVGEKYFIFDVYKGEIRVDSYIWDGDSVDYALYRNHNCFRTHEEAEAAIPRVKAALKGEVGDKVMSREEADSSMRSEIGICAIIDKNTSLSRENNKLKEELESLIIRCEYLQKAKEQLISQQSEIDGKPLTHIEKEAIRKFRAGVPFPEAESGTWRALSPGEDALVRAMRKALDKHFLVITKRNNDLSCHSCCIASPHDIDEEIRNAIKRIQKEQEG